MQNVGLGTFLMSDQQCFEGCSGGRELMNGYQSIPVCNDSSKILPFKSDKYYSFIKNNYHYFQENVGKVTWDLLSEKNLVPGDCDKIRYEFTITDPSGKNIKTINMHDYDPDNNSNLNNWAYNSNGFTLVFKNNDMFDLDQTAYHFDWNGNLISQTNCEHDMSGLEYQGVMYSVNYDEGSNTSTLVATDADSNNRNIAVFPNSKINTRSGAHFSVRGNNMVFFKNYGTTVNGCHPGDHVKLDLTTGKSTNLLTNICCEWTGHGYIRTKDAFGSAYYYYQPTEAARKQYLQDVTKFVYVV